MVKWADYVITAVRHSADGSRIADLEVRTDSGERLSSGMEWPRAQVIRAVDGGYSFVTAYLRDDRWRRGADVVAVGIGQERFLRTDCNAIRTDNLGELPEMPLRAAGAGRW